MERGAIQFEFHGHFYAIFISKAACFPQAYAAAVTILKSLRDKPKAITMYNQVKSKVSAELDVLLEESEIDAILKGQHEHVPAEVSAMVERQAQAYVNDMFSTLRERGLELRSGVVVFVGGGAVLLKRQIEVSGRVANPMFVEDIRANAKGFEMLYQITQEEK